MEQHQQDAEQRGWEGWGEACPSPAIHGVLLGDERGEMMKGIKTRRLVTKDAVKRFVLCEDLQCFPTVTVSLAFQ